MPTSTETRIVRNPLVDRAAVPAADDRSAAFHRQLPGWAPTPLQAAPTAALALGVASVQVKDESSRLAMPSFKILGASWASYRALLAHLGDDAPTGEVTLAELRSALGPRPVTLVAATDGNHGRAVARMASLLGLAAIILVPRDMVTARREAIRAEGADLRVVDGGYDDAIDASAALADAEHVVISDTSWEGYTEVPRWVIDGYGTLTGEILTDLELITPTVVAAQIGVGAFAAAIARGFAGGPARLLVGVEPTLADCVTVSIAQGHPVTIPGPQNSSMAGLNCGTPSVTAWADVSRGFDTFVTVDDSDTEDAMRLLAADGIASGESGAAGLAGLLRHREGLGLGPDDHVLVVSTEGPTDPVNYERVCGFAPVSHLEEA
ncbi:diaminopropionate ammonia-lyase [Raineyella sp. W15-4]|uniref:diaminopropionate ammonia-lyase n=1 Tax=Raineyella sp. W15-4 TaxID=3081651 RepID=UPI002953D16D|nr:diaminopropionate ammonia-lyase [Raineyella sp. W15-4]WOQ17038.1 diaminopropionate ammonia-lyase [Raineyella sp. W15-4]